MDEMAISDTDASPGQPVVRKIGPADLWDVLARGVDDFKAKPSHILLLVLLYPIVGLILIRVTAGYDILPLVFPILAGFALLGPMAAIGLYELSRRRELGLDVAWKHAFDVVRSPSTARNREPPPPKVYVRQEDQLVLVSVWLENHWLLEKERIYVRIVSTVGTVHGHREKGAGLFAAGGKHLQFSVSPAGSMHLN